MSSSKTRHGKIIAKGDTVYVTTGNERGNTGTVIANFGERVLVEGLNVRKKHVKKSEQHPNGGIIEREAPLHISNLRLFVKEGKPVKIKVKTDEQGQRQLYYKEGKEEVVYRQIKKRKT